MQTPDLSLTDIQREVLKVIIELFKEDGVAPIPKRLRERIGRDVRTSVRNLKDLGYVAIPYKGGPIKILRDMDGAPVLSVLARTGIAPEQAKLFR